MTERNFGQNITYSRRITRLLLVILHPNTVTIPKATLACKKIYSKSFNHEKSGHKTNTGARKILLTRKLKARSITKKSEIRRAKFARATRIPVISHKPDLAEFCPVSLRRTACTTAFAGLSAFVRSYIQFGLCYALQRDVSYSFLSRVPRSEVKPLGELPWPLFCRCTWSCFCVRQTRPWQTNHEKDACFVRNITL